MSDAKTSRPQPVRQLIPVRAAAVCPACEQVHEVDVVESRVPRGVPGYTPPSDQRIIPCDCGRLVDAGNLALHAATPNREVP